MLTFVRVIGLPSEEDWPADSPISYCIQWGLKCPGTKPLHNLDPDQNHLLSVSWPAFFWLWVSLPIKYWLLWKKLAQRFWKRVLFSMLIPSCYFFSLPPPAAIFGLHAVQTDLCCQGAGSSVLHPALKLLVTGGITMSSASSLQPSDKRLLFFDSPTRSVFVYVLPSVTVVSAECFPLSDTWNCSNVELVCGVFTSFICDLWWTFASSTFCFVDICYRVS